ncbi:MAG: SRPBCC family protein [Acidimicrobiia bacterium]
MVDSIVIDSSPEPIWEWLTNLATRYTKWHPDHVSAEWELGEPNQVGSIMRAVEDLGGTREVLRFEMTSIEPPHRFEYRIRGPISMLLPGGAFTVTPHNGVSRFTATISYRFGAVTELLFRGRMSTLAEHMREEGENLKRIIESTQ